jgi:hypothetical protein
MFPTVKCLALIIVLASGIFCASAVGMTGKPNKAPSFAEQKSQSQPQQPTIASINNETRTPDHQHTGNNPPHWYASLERPEWWLVALGFPTLIILAWQAWETRRAAQAAQRSIETVDSENRPWLLMEFGEQCDRISHPQQSPDRPAVCTFYIKNYGRRPAKLLLLKADLVIGTSPKQPPSGEIVETEKRFNPQILPQGESLPKNAQLLASAATEFSEALNYMTGQKFLWLRGTIEYTHTIAATGTASYRTTFSYLYEMPSGDWRLINSEAK